LAVENNQLTAGTRVDEVNAAVGARVRALRMTRGWSLEELSGRSGVSKGMVVQIEAARTNPSIGTLCRLADAFGVTIARLIEPPSHRAVRVSDVDAAPELWRGASGGTGRLLGGLHEASFVELWEWTLQPGEEHRSPEHAPGARELIHVRAGTLTVTVDGTGYEVRGGQTIEFIADRAHGYRNTGLGACQLAMIVAMPTAEHDRRDS
jgi:transcriptional regulator with XRE-family HTH domain